MRRESKTSSIKWDETGRVGVFTNPDTGEPATDIPPAVLLRLIQAGRIPVAGVVSADGETVNLFDLHLMDERAYCSRAINGDAAGGAGCPCLAGEPGARYCSLNGRERADPCVFDEAPDAPVWASIREYVARWEGGN